MLNAILYGKSGTASDGSNWRNLFHHSEDLLSAVVWTRISYLPYEWIVKLLTALYPKLSEHLKASGVFKNVEFWPLWTASVESDQKRVEPDIVFHFEKLDILIEAKRYDSVQQYPEQWMNQIEAYRLKYPLGESKLLFCAIGGLGINPQKTIQNFTKVMNNRIKELPVIDGSTWLHLMYVISNLQTNKNMPVHCKRILKDILKAMELNGFWKPSYLSDLKSYNLKSDSNKIFSLYPLLNSSYYSFYPVQISNLSMKVFSK